MARRRFEMFHFRQALLRMRQGDSDREIAASKVMGRRKAAALRQVASARGWLGAGGGVVFHCWASHWRRRRKCSRVSGG